ncbi:methyltransferase [Hypericibacter terrae]|jgi:SAM-dependent methyltransferase|uniref:Methyltransferase n=1 Tax=Hypericibacter terrae TaxID=2602015 RepID=A0A5J6ML83_9PROT|nr:class I SAM-dependent methyltransferase [Hypericibacter terrae]QEX18342.1 methyltransferase [Hypericibacter terrae]
MYRHAGSCPICETAVTFASGNAWYRDNLRCPLCWSVVRERALALALDAVAPDWRGLAIHESSPARRGISVKLRREAPGYVASQFFRFGCLEAMLRGGRHEDLAAQRFPDGRFDLVIALDVMEHVFEPAKVYREVYRTLKPGGYCLLTFPIDKNQAEAARRRAERTKLGFVRHLVEPPQYHGGSIGRARALVTFDYGYAIGHQIPKWAPFEVDIRHFHDEDHGILGEYTDVVICRRPA